MPQGPGPSPYGGDPYGGGPNYGQGGAPPRPTRPTWVKPAAIVAVVAALGAVGYFLTKGDDSSGLSTATAAKQVAAAVDQFDLAAGDTVALDGCEGFDMDAVAKVAPDAFDASAVADGVISSFIFLSGSSRDPALLQCIASNGTDGLFYAVAGAPPRDADFAKYLGRVGVDESDVDDPVAFDGGTLHPFCTTLVSGDQLCETVWTNDDLQIGIAGAGDGIDTKVTTTWLRAALPGMLTELGKMNPDKVVAADG
jgi:hypothetical protein